MQSSGIITDFIFFAGILCFTTYSHELTFFFLVAFSCFVFNVYNLFFLDDSFVRQLKELQVFKYLDTKVVKKKILNDYPSKMLNLCIFVIVGNFLVITGIID